MPAPPRILVLERDEPVRRLLVTMLERNGYEVLHGSGVAAFRAYVDGGTAVHLVISELAIQAPPGLPVLVLRKPFRIAELLREAQGLLSSGRIGPRRAQSEPRKEQKIG